MPSSERDKTRARAWLQANKPRKNAMAKSWRSRNPEKANTYRLRCLYGLESDPRINDACWICGSTKNLVIDHNHSTGTFRGVLCGPCNRGIGHFYDNPESLRQAAAYLEGALEYQKARREVENVG